jgi:hypothetical protein
VLFALVDFGLAATTAIDFPKWLTAMLARKVFDAMSFYLLRVTR